MANVARTPADVVLGEAVHGTREQRFKDMVAIASVIENRAKSLGVSANAVISAPKQFDAYGKSLPAGTAAYRDLAKEAIEYVEKNGPVHTGTFYATPSATKNLPSGLQPVDTTKGHQFFEDPQARPIQTAVGLKTPFIPGPLDAPANINRQTALPAGYGPITTAPSVPGAGMAALAPNGLTGKGSMSFYNPEQSTIAGPMKDALTGLSAEMGQSLGITSGYRSPSYNASVPGAAKNSMHTKGLAADIDMTGWSTEERQKAIQELTQRGVGGFITYSKSPNMMHVDMRARPNGVAPHFMFDKTAAKIGKAPDYFKEMAAFGGIKTPDSVSVPPSRPTATPSFSAPAGQVTRGPSLPDPTQTAAMPSLGMAGLTAPSFTPESAARMMASAPVAPTQTFSQAPQAPAAPVDRSAVPANPSQLGGIHMSNPLGAFQVPSAPIAMAPAIPAPTTIAPQPAVVAPTLATSRLSNLPSAPRSPTFTPSDIYGGQVGTAQSSSGNVVGRDDFGFTSVTNKHGATTVTTPGGMQAAQFGGIKGPLGTAGIEAPKADGFLGKSGPEWGQMAKTGVAGVAGSAIGSLGGPIGSLIGSAVARELSKPGGGLVGGLFNGTKTINTSKIAGFAPMTVFAKQQGGLSFPGVPGGGYRGSASFSNRSEGGMRDISPAAARDISKGKAGLY